MILPDGSSIQLSLRWLEHTPFQDYLIPGIILFIMNGLLSILILGVLLLRVKNYEWLVVIQGVILISWISTQIILIQTINFLHLILGLTGVSMIISGLLLKEIGKKGSQQNIT